MSVGELALELLGAATHCSEVEIDLTPLQPLVSMLKSIGQPLMEEPCTPYVDALKASDSAATFAEAQAACPTSGQYNQCVRALLKTAEQILPS